MTTNDNDLWDDGFDTPSGAGRPATTAAAAAAAWDTQPGAHPGSLLGAPDHAGDGLLDDAGDVGSDVLDLGADVAGAGASTVGNAWEATTDLLGGAADAVASGAGHLVDGLAGLVDSSPLVDHATDVASHVFDLGGDVVDAEASAAGFAWDAATGLAGGMTDMVTHDLEGGLDAVDTGVGFADDLVTGADQLIEDL